MDIRFAHSLFQALEDDGPTFGYSGAFHDEHTAALIALGEASLDVRHVGHSARGRLAFVMVEAYQNIIRHRPELPPTLADDAGRSLFLLRCTPAGQHVVAMNPVGHAANERLHAELERLRGMDRTQLKQLFLAGLQRTGDPRSRGAGLGLIEMARRSGGGLDHAVQPLDKDHDLFVLAVQVGEELRPGGIIALAEQLRQEVRAHDIRMFHVGRRSVAIDEALLRIVQKDEEVGNDRALTRRKACLAMAELMAGLREGTTAPGLFLLSVTGDRTLLTAGQVLPPPEAGVFEDQMTTVLSWDGSRLQQQYRDALLGRGDRSVPLGLLDLARNSLEPLAFATFPAQAGRLTLVQAVV